jgi:hypothetical protein
MHVTETRMRQSLGKIHFLTLGVASLAMLTACGGGGSSPAPAPAPAPTPTAQHLTGSAAVGAPLTQGTLRVIDATGTVVAHDVPINADGTYDAGVLTGTGPWRIEACGYTGPNYGCIYSIAQAAGTANVTPLTTAMITLATGQKPEAVMSAASAPGTSDLDAAQTQLRTGLGSTLADAGVPTNIDFTTGTLQAGTRSGYDRLLDAVNVTTGTDNGAFVQVTPRLGDGNLYMTTGSTSGTITTDAGASALPLDGLETLFKKMTAAVASADACASSTTGLSTVVASDAHISMGDGTLTGGAQVAAGLCQFFAAGGGNGGSDSSASAIWGAQLVSPVLGRCDLTGADPLCAISFAIQMTDGTIQNVGDGIGVVYRDKHWQFYGDLLPMAINANAAVQRSVRVDDSTTPVQYQRALQFDIARTDGVACAMLSARNDAHSTIAIYKVYAPDAPRMSLWTTDGMSNGASTDPTVGALRGSDDTWLSLPQGTAGDDVIRTFYRAGRTVDVAIYSDAACSTPALVGGKSSFAVDVAGMPPVDSAMASLAWGSLTDATVAALEAFTVDGGHTSSFSGAWTFADGITGFDEATFCIAGSCGDGQPSRLGQSRVRPGALSAVTSLSAPATHVLAGDYKEYILGGRDSTGMNIESEFVSCTSTPAGQMCGQGPAPIGGSSSSPTAAHTRSH